MKYPVTYAGLAVGAILLIGTMLRSLSGADETPPNSPGAAAARVESAPRPPGHTPRTTLLFNDPIHDPRGISDAITANIDGTASTGSIDVSAYLIDSRRIASALQRAHQRGVAVRAILAGQPSRRTATSQALAKVLNANRDRSWLVWSQTAARARGGHLHEKTFRFSRVGDADWVTMTGSYNAADVADRASYATMWQVTGHRPIYEAFAAVADEQRAQGAPARPFRQFEGDGWSAYFLPSGPLRPGRDPVLARLERIPADPRSEIRVAMFSMWGERGVRIAERLAGLARGGARVTFVAGPTVSIGVLDVLRAGGVRIRSGCFADGRYAHGKDMSATYLVEGQREFWTWVGSDNWTSRGMESDQAVLGLSGVGYQQFGRAFSRLLSRDDGVFGSDCQPIP